MHAERVTRAARIYTLLTDALRPATLTIADESARHAGHAGAQPGGETHYRIEISSAHFVGLSRVEQHRLVTSLLAKEFASGLHALSLKTTVAEI